MQPVTRYDAVIFDLFGTLVDIFLVEQHNRMIAEMAHAIAAPVDEFIRLWVGTFAERASGVFMSTEENVLHVARLLHLQPTEAQVEHARQLRWDFARTSLEPRRDAIKTITQLRKHGLKIGLISDCSSEIPVLWNETPFAPLFDATIFSCTACMRKPDPRLYVLACQQLSVDPTRCLYVGDGGGHELSGALKSGMHPVMIRAPHEYGVDVYRSDAEEWEGDTITSLAQVLNYI